MCVYLYLSIYLSIYLSVDLSPTFSVCLSVYLSVCRLVVHLSTPLCRSMPSLWALKASRQASDESSEDELIPAAPMPPGPSLRREAGLANATISVKDDRAMLNVDIASAAGRQCDLLRVVVRDPCSSGLGRIFGSCWG